MTKTCRNCLNAYNSPHSAQVFCWNKEFLAQFESIDTTVKPDETCGTFQTRADNQPALKFNQSIQLSLF